MKFDNVIIGGGLCGLTAGISLIKKGYNTAIVSTGQSALHFSSGAFGLLGYKDGALVSNPLEAMQALDESHPYKKVGIEHVAEYAVESAAILKEAGVDIKGDANVNHFALTPFGKSRPAWLTLNELLTSPKDDAYDVKKVLIINLQGFLEFYPSFIKDELDKLHIPTRIESVTLERIEKMRKASFDMRAASLAKQMDAASIAELAGKINALATEDETVILPAVFGIKNDKPMSELRREVKAPLYCVPTIPVSVIGVRVQNQLQRYFEKLGGTYFLGDKVKRGFFEGDTLKAVETENLGNDYLEANNFILASGSIFSEGIVANPQRFYEPVFDLNLNSPEDRALWYVTDVFDPQPYMNYGVVTDSAFRGMKAGSPIGNLYAAGAVLGHCNALKEDSGAGVAMITALKVADIINLKK